MKRAILIATGTLGGLGAVLMITPPQLGESGLLAGASASTSDQVQPAQSSAAVAPTPSASASKSATSSASGLVKSGSSKSSNQSSSASSNSATASSTPTPTKSVATGTTGSFTGDVVNVGYGNVQVKITIENGKITDAVALQAPNGRSQRFTDYAVPNLRSQTLQVQSAAINGVSGASYTSYGWYKSLISALQNAGMATGV
jgi:uncharacterized protein with FMN-binding domain